MGALVEFRSDPRRVAVVGGGIAGLAAADALADAGYVAEVFEAAEQLGGRIAIDRLTGREVCLGGKNVGRRYSAFRALAERDGPRRWEFFGPETMQVAGRRLTPMSFSRKRKRLRMGARLAARGQIGGLRRFMRLASQVKREEASGFLGDEWFAELAAAAGEPSLPDYFGRVFCDTVVRHTTVRMNAAEPDEITLGTFGSNLALVVDKFDQLTDGVGPVVDSVAARHRVHLGAPVRALVSDGDRIAGVGTGDGELHDGFAGVVLAVPAPAAARIVRATDPDLAALLRTIVYHPVAVVVASYDRPVFPPGFAAVATPPDMPLSNAGAYGLADKHLVRYTFSGRAARDRIAPETFDPATLLREAEDYLERFLPLAEARRTGLVAHTFVPGLCAYRPGHSQFRQSVQAQLEDLPGLALAGDYMRGASLEASARSGIDAAASLAATRAGADLPTPVGVR